MPTGTSGLLPIPAWDERNHWRGRLPPSVLPRVYDPPEGFVAAANEDINAPGGPRLVTLIVPDYRKRRIDERLRRLGPGHARGHAGLAIRRGQPASPRSAAECFCRACPRARSSAGWPPGIAAISPSSIEATLFSRLYRNVLLEIFGQEHGIGWRRMLYLGSRVGFSTMVLTAIDRLLVKETFAVVAGTRQRRVDPPRRRSAWRKNRRSPGRSPTAFISPIDLSTTASSAGRSGFTPRDGHARLPRHAVSRPLAARAARREATFAPSYHFVTDMGTDEAWTNLPGGPSESRVSGYYKNDIPRWCSGEYKLLAPLDSGREPWHSPSAKQDEH